MILFDLDRTLCGTDKVSRHLIDSLRSNWPEVADDIEKSISLGQGLRYDPWSDIRSRLSTSDIKGLRVSMMRGLSPSYFYVDEAEGLIAEINTRGIDFGIMTYGDPEYQRLKLEFMGLSDVPVLVTSEPGAKASLIGSWRQEGSGAFAIPDALGGCEAELVMLVDDKLDELIPARGGLVSVLFDTQGRYSGQKATVSYIVDKLTKILEITDTELSK